MRLIRLVLALAIVVALTPTADAQRLGPQEKKRPKLSASADTNDATAYLQHGTRILETSADEAASAFYWAARLDPSSADALYGRSVALAMRKASTLSTYLYPLAQAQERSQDAEGAKTSYQRFLALAARRDPSRDAAAQRLTALGGTAR